MDVLDLSGNLLYHGRLHKQSIYKMAFNDDGRFLAAASAFSSWSVINVETRRQIMKKPGRLNFLKILFGFNENHLADAIAFSKDITAPANVSSNRNLIAVGRDDGKTEIWDMKSKHCLLQLPGHDGPVLGIAFAPDNKSIVTSGRDAKSNIWDISNFKSWKLDSNGTPIDRRRDFELKGHHYAVVAVTFSPDGKMIATASEDRTAKLWNGKTGDELISFVGSREGYLTNLSISHDGAQLATASQDKSAKLWEISSKNHVLQLNSLLSSLNQIQFKAGLSSAESKMAILETLKEVSAILPGSLTDQDCQRYWNKECSKVLSRNSKPTP